MIKKNGLFTYINSFYIIYSPPMLHLLLIHRIIYNVMTTGHLHLLRKIVCYDRKLQNRMDRFYYYIHIMIYTDKQI